MEWNDGKPVPFATAILSDHAVEEMERRKIKDDILRNVLHHPEHVAEVRPGRIVIQKIVFAEDLQKMVLYRAVVDIDRDPPMVVTVYRTSKIKKYMGLLS